jgi:hypothetical protein
VVAVSRRVRAVGGRPRVRDVNPRIRWLLEVIGVDRFQTQTSTPGKFAAAGTVRKPSQGTANNIAVGVALQVLLAGARGWRTVKSMGTMSLEAGAASGALGSNGAASPRAVQSCLVPVGAFVARRLLV